MGPSRIDFLQVAMLQRAIKQRFLLIVHNNRESIIEDYELFAVFSLGIHGKLRTRYLRALLKTPYKNRTFSSVQSAGAARVRRDWQDEKETAPDLPGKRKGAWTPPRGSAHAHRKKNAGPHRFLGEPFT